VSRTPLPLGLDSLTGPTIVTANGVINATGRDVAVSDTR